MKITKNFSIKDQNSLKVATTSKYYIAVRNQAELLEVINSVILKDNNFVILGNGTNILFIPAFFNGVIIKNSITDKLLFKIENNRVNIHVSAGIDFDFLIKEFIYFQMKNNIVAFGFENLASIPGNVGGAIVSNIGAYGVEQSDYFDLCCAVNMLSGKQRWFSKEECNFGYRSSVFKTHNSQQPNSYFITEAKYSIPISSTPILSNQELKQKLQHIDLTPQIIYNVIAAIRKQKLPSIEEYPNVGSFFKNPIVSDKILSSILTKDPGVAYHSDGINKISAGSLIEHCGAKGIRVGNVGVSEKHALVIVNYGNATGEDIYNFSNYIGDKVFSKFGIELEPEVVFVK